MRNSTIPFMMSNQKFKSRKVSVGVPGKGKKKSVDDISVI